MYEFLQRKTTKKRRSEAAGYIRDRFAPESPVIGAFPSISVGMVQPVEYKPSEDVKGAGLLVLDLSAENRRVLLDGLARLTGALDLEEAGEKVGEWFTFPVTLYAPSEERGRITLNELGQLFHDFNFLATAVTATHAIALDRADIYIRLTTRLAQTPVVNEHGGVEERASSLGKKSTALVVQRLLLRFVRGACEGALFQESNRSATENPNLAMETFDELGDLLEAFLARFAMGMGDRFSDRDGIHRTSPGWQALGRIFHEMVIVGDVRPGDPKYDGYMARLAAIDWSRYNPDWIGLLGEPERDKVTQELVLDESGRERVAMSRAGRTANAALHQYLRTKIGLVPARTEEGASSRATAT